MLLAVTYCNKVFNKTRHKEIIRDRRSEKRKRVMRGGNTEEGNQIVISKGIHCFLMGINDRCSI